MTKKDEIATHEKILVFGRIVCKYKAPQEFVDDINAKYEDVLNHTNLLTSHGKNLAGRIDSELDVLPIIRSVKIFKFITQCMSDYIDTCIEHGICRPGPHNLDLVVK